MNREEFFYLLPYVFSLALSLGVFIYTWQHRYVRGARLYSWFMGGQILTILAFIFELVSPNLQTKLLWDKFQWLTDSFLVILPFLFFSVQFSEYKLHYPRLTWGGILTFPIIFAALVLTDNIHHLIYPNPHLSTDYPFPELQYKFTIIVYGYALIYLYIANLYGISLLIRRAVQPNNLYRRQYWTIIAGFLIPLILSTFAFANLRITPQRDITPFSLALGNLIVAWGLFRYRIFDIVPIAREQIVENIADPVVVLDATNRIVDINPAALRLLGRSSAETIGRVSNEAFARWPVLVSELEYLDVERKEITIQEDDDIFFYDLKISPMYNTNRQMIGRILVAHDITRHKTLESGYRILSEELEQRVKERTDELRHTAERYRAVVENQTEFIVRWKPDGTRTFVNEAYCRYWRLTFEEALAINFLAHIHEEDRQAVDEKISRLISGRLTAKTETHRVIKPDGSIAWHEWTDQVIRNEAGDLIEFQSVGRDVTEHKQAEKALRESEEKLRTLFNILPVGISVLDKDRQITEMNPRLQEILKIPSKELLEGKSQQRKYIKSDGTPISAEEFPSTRAFKEQKQVLNNELGILKDDGELIWVNVSAAPLPGFGVVVTTTDITERKRAEEALRESEAIYRQAIEVAGAVPYRQSYPGEEFHITYDFIGEGIRKITGYGPDEFYEELWDSMVQESHPAGELAQYSWREAVQRVRTGASPIWQCEHRIQARNGETRWVYEAAVELRDKDGQSHGSIGLFQDVTERKQVEEALRTSEERFSKAFQASPIIITIFQINNGKIIEVNDAFEKISGYSREEAIGKIAVELGLWENQADRDRIISVLAAKGKLRNEEIRFRTKNGDTLTCLCSAETIDLSGKICALATIEDITERKKAEAALQNSEERFSKAFQSSPIIITISQVNDGKLLEVNDTFGKVMGFSREEVIGKTAAELELWANLSDRERIMQKFLANGKLKNEELQFRTKNGSIITCNYSAEVIELDGEKCTLAIVEDITDRKKAEARILHLNRLYVTISQINQTIVHARDKASLFNDICRVAIEHGKFRMAWIGLVDNEKVEPTVFAGEELGYLKSLGIDFR